MKTARNPLRTAMLVSVLWHLIWLSIVHVSVVPSVRARKVYPQVNFLGPILGKTAFEMMAENAAPKSEMSYRSPIMVTRQVALKAEGPVRMVKRDMFASGNTHRDLMVRGYVGDEKDMLRGFIGGRSLFYHIREKKLHRLIEGPAKNRAVLSRPEMPIFSKSFYEQDDHFVMKYRFVLGDDGTVEHVEPVIVSGYPDIDMKGMNFVKQWKFVPRHPDAGGEKEWGVMTVNVTVQ